MVKRVLLIALPTAVAVCAAIWMAQSQKETLPVVDAQSGRSGGPSMCPWREPERDIKAFFGRADATYRTDTLALSSIRQKILRRLGPNARLESNSLYVHRVTAGVKPLGSVVVRRAAGPFGAIEVVTAARPDGGVIGVRIQRHREPEETARVITSSSWLDTFKGLTSRSSFDIGNGIPLVPKDAADAASTVAATVRAVLIEMDEADDLYGSRSPSHH